MTGILKELAESKAPIPFFEAIYRALRPLQLQLIFILPFLISIIAGGGLIALRLEADRQLLAAIGTHASSLIETEDRIDLQRLLDSIAKNQGTTLMAIRRGIVVASTESLSAIERPFAPSEMIRLSQFGGLSRTGLVTQIPIRRTNGPTHPDASLVISTPLGPMLLTVLVIGCGLAGMGFLIGIYLSRRLDYQIRTAIEPIRDLDQAIRQLKDVKSNHSIPKSEIAELENIRRTILETNEELQRALETLAERRAKELSLEAYQRLLHDLHSPILSLHNLVSLTSQSCALPEAAWKYGGKITKIAEQIVRQIEAARENLDFEVPKLVPGDLRTCVQESSEEASLSTLFNANASLQLNLPKNEVIALYDFELLKRALINLIRNALQACRTQVLVTIETGLSEGLHLVEIRVKDDGPGIEGNSAKLFLEGKEKSTKGERNARGLAAVNHIARSHGAKVIYRPSELGGACFAIRF